MCLFIAALITDKAVKYILHVGKSQVTVSITVNLPLVMIITSRTKFYVLHYTPFKGYCVLQSFDSLMQRPYSKYFRNVKCLCWNFWKMCSYNCIILFGGASLLNCILLYMFSYSNWYNWGAHNIKIASKSNIQFINSGAVQAPWKEDLIGGGSIMIAGLNMLVYVSFGLESVYSKCCFFLILEWILLQPQLIVKCLTGD